MAARGQNDRDHDAVRHTEGGSKTKVPQPAKFSGEDRDVVEDVIFTFENYLSGNKVPRSEWPSVAMPLLSGKALSVWIAFAQPLQERRVTPTWDQFVEVLSQAFAKPDRQLAARRALLDIKQTSSVQEFLQRMHLALQDTYCSVKKDKRASDFKGQPRGGQDGGGGGRRDHQQNHQGGGSYGRGDNGGHGHGGGGRDNNNNSQQLQLAEMQRQISDMSKMFNSSRGHDDKRGN